MNLEDQWCVLWRGECPECGVVLQVTRNRRADGIRPHYSFCHPGKAVPLIDYSA